MISHFYDDESEAVWLGRVSRKLPPDIQPTARRKLRAINRAPLRANSPFPAAIGLRS